MKRFRTLLLLVAILLTLVIATPALAATTQDVTVTATPAFVGISCNQSSYDFGVVAASATPYTVTDWADITNSSTVQTDNTISVTAASWSGGVGWTHSDTATAGADTAGLLANADGTWGVSDVIVKYSSPNFIAENQAATTDFAFGLKLLAPTSFSDGVEKSITVRVSSVAG